MNADDFENEDLSEREEMVLKCGYPGCCMPGYHFRHECHNADDLIRLEQSMEKIVRIDRSQSAQS